MWYYLNVQFQDQRVNKDRLNLHIYGLHVCVYVVITFPIYMPHPSSKKSIQHLTLTYFRDHIFPLPQWVLHEWKYKEVLKCLLYVITGLLYWWISNRKIFIQNVTPLLNPLDTKFHTAHETTFPLSSQILW
jgi:hypothetical protein